MSTDEARIRLVTAAFARAFGDEQLRMVLNAQIADGDHLVPGEKALETLTTEELAYRARLQIEANPSLLAAFVEGRRGVGGSGN